MQKTKERSVVHIHVPEKLHTFLKIQAVFLNVKLGDHVLHILQTYKNTIGNDFIKELSLDKGKSSLKKGEKKDKKILV